MIQDLTYVSEERLPTHHRLPNREMIWAMSDAAALIELRDDVQQAQKRIEVDLEFDTARDEEWARRARTALAAHQVCMSNLTNRIRQLTGTKGVDTATAQREGAERKVRKAEANAVRLAEEAKARADRMEADKLKTQRAMIEFANRQCWLSAFQRVCRDELDNGTYGRLVEMANALMRS